MPKQSKRKVPARLVIQAGIRAREQELLPVPYFHVVFTIPQVLNTLCLYKPADMYNILFQSVWGVLHTFGNDHKWLGAKTGMISILHTWGQTLTLHPHLHCIVPGGGITKQGKWKTAKSDGKYLFDVKAMSKVFRGKFIALLKEKLPGETRKQLINELYKNEWVVYAKRPFNGPQSVIEYLGRYTHKIATCLPAGRSAIIALKIWKMARLLFLIKITGKVLQPKK